MEDVLTQIKDALELVIWVSLTPIKSGKSFCIKLAMVIKNRKNVAKGVRRKDKGKQNRMQID